MNGPRFQAWAFAHPTPAGLPAASEPLRPAGVQLSATGGIGLVADHASVRQAILLLLATSPGERVMRPSYGCDLHRLVFAPNDAGTAGLAIHYVRQAVQRWEPRVEIVRVDAGRNLSGSAAPGEAGVDEAATLEILLEYRLRATGHRERLLLGIDLMGGRPHAAAYTES